MSLGRRYADGTVVPWRRQAAEVPVRCAMVVVFPGRLTHQVRHPASSNVSDAPQYTIAP